MTIYSLLKHDHRTVENLFKEIENLYETKEEIKSNPNEAEKIFSKIKKNLKIHSEAEEITFYDALKKNKTIKDMILHAQDEHAKVNKLLDELGTKADFNDKWFTKLYHLKEMVEHHVDEEENKIFKEAQKILSPEKEKGLAEDFVKNKETLQRLNP